MIKTQPDLLIRALAAMPRAKAAELCTKLGGTHQSNLSRALKKLGPNVITRGKASRSRYALRRSIRGHAEPLPLYRIDEQGRGTQIGELDCIAPFGTALTHPQDLGWPLIEDMRDGWFDSLPYPLADSRPQGFIGRNFARHYAPLLSVSENPDRWSDDDVIHVLSTLGFDQPGNLILGESAYLRFLDQKRLGAKHFLHDEEIDTHYPQLAQSALSHGVPDSSAGGEFPKFTTHRMLDNQATEVIVKFSGADHSPTVQRWSDLLICEHLALQALESLLEIPSAKSRIYRFENRTFLEVIRFDRQGALGRSGVCTLHSINAALLGTPSPPWNKVAITLHRQNLLSENDTRHIALMWWFGHLIGNSDMHEGNLAFYPGLKLAPAYDMLPMLYAPARGGEVPERVFSPKLPLPADTEIWSEAAQAAIQYWEHCAQDPRISAAFRQICIANANIVRTLQMTLN